MKRIVAVAPSPNGPSSSTGTGFASERTFAVSGPAGTVHLPLRITPMPDRVVWLPLNSVGGGIAADLGVVPGQVVSVSAPATEVAQ